MIPSGTIIILLCLCFIAFSRISNCVALNDIGHIYNVSIPVFIVITLKKIADVPDIFVLLSIFIFLKKERRHTQYNFGIW